jgi:MFS transporter, DHA2 family, multidrug resistance protein
VRPIGSVAMLIRPDMRTTAIGVMYAVLGAATVATQILLGLLATTPAIWVAFVPCMIVSVVAITLLPTTLPPGVRIDRASRLSLGALCLFAFGVVATGAAVIQLTPTLDPLRLVVLFGGVAAMLAASGVHRAAVAAGGGTEFKIRAISIVLIIGIIVGFAQAAPLLQLPLYFEGVRGISPIMNFVALAPLFAGLVLAGPATGWILARWDGRLVIAGGALAIGVANLSIAAVLGRMTPYVWFIVPMTLIGAGFVVATTVRTAILFASVPRQMSASAVGLNEASVGLGNRVGVVVATGVFTVVAVRAYAGTVADAATSQSEVESFRDLLGTIGLTDLQSVTAGLEPATLEAYRHAAVAGFQASLVIAGLVAIAGALLALARLPAQGQLRAWGSGNDSAGGERF